RLDAQPGPPSALLRPVHILPLFGFAGGPQLALRGAELKTTSAAPRRAARCQSRARPRQLSRRVHDRPITVLGDPSRRLDREAPVRRGREARLRARQSGLTRPDASQSPARWLPI